MMIMGNHGSDRWMFGRRGGGVMLIWLGPYDIGQKYGYYDWQGFYALALLGGSIGRSLLLLLCNKHEHEHTYVKYRRGH